MKKFLEKKWLVLAYGFLLIAVGVLTIVYAIIDQTVVTKVLSISIAVSLFLIGSANIVLALVAHTSDFFNKTLIVGSAAIAAGVLFCIDTLLLGQFIAYLLGVFFLAFALVCLIKFILFIVYKQKVAWIVIYAIVVLVSIAAGVLILCFREETSQVLYVIIGSFIALAGLFEIIGNARIIILAKREEKIREQAQPVDADAHVVENIKQEDNSEENVVEVKQIENDEHEQLPYNEEPKE